jgi:Leucine-rich repeat (LRR) protein
MKEYLFELKTISRNASKKLLKEYGCLFLCLKEFSYNKLNLNNDMFSLVPNLSILEINVRNFNFDLRVLENIRSTQLKCFQIIAYDYYFYSPSMLDLSHLRRFSNLSNLYVCIQNMELPPGIFKCLSKLEKLLIYSDSISGLDRSEITSLNNLKIFRMNTKLFLNDGKIEENVTKCLKRHVNKLTSLEYLDLSYIAIVELDSEIIGKLINLKHLVLDNCCISKIKDDTFSNLTNLEVIDLSNNRLNQQTKDLKKKHKLGHHLVLINDD